MTANAVFLPYQQKWAADRSEVKVCEKSRRVGLSWGEAADSTIDAAKANGMDTWYIGYTKDMAVEFIRDCGDWAKHFNYAASEMEELVLKDEDKDIQAFRITFASGFRVTALSSSPRNLRGKQGRVIIDEAAFHDNLGELIKAAMALLIWGGRVHIISTHNGVDNPFNELIKDIRAGKKPYSLHRITFDEALAQGLCKRVFESTKRAWSPEAEIAWAESIRANYRPNDAEELDCIPSKSGGAYLNRALIEQRMSDDAVVLRYTCPDGFEQLPDDVREAHAADWLREEVAPVLATIPKTDRCSVGVDFGRTGDLSVFTPLAESHSLLRKAPCLLELRNVPFKQQEQILFFLCDNLPRFNHMALDARGNGQYLAEVALQRYGASSVTQVMLTQNWYLENMPKLKAAFEDGTLESIPQDRDVLDDLRAIQVIKGIPRIPETKTKTGQGQQRHGDAAVSICMAWYASCQGGGTIEYIPVATKPRNRQASAAGFGQGNSGPEQGRMRGY